MAPSWLPQNIQRRVFRYVLDRLAVFSNLKLDDLDVQLGTTRSDLSLQNVKLDTERLSMPGLYVRDGSISKLDLQLGVTSGVNVIGSDISLTIAVSSKMLSEEEVSTLLSQTTASLAENIMDPHVKDDEISEEGFGIGDFGNVISKIVDATISQIHMDLKHVYLRIIVDNSTYLNLSFSSITFITDKNGCRHLSLSDLDLFTWYSEDNTTDEMNISDESDSEIDPSMMASTIFGRSTATEAPSLYMSAVSEAPRPGKTKKSLVSIDNTSLSFKGINLDDLVVEIGNIRLSAQPISEILDPLLRAVRNVQLHRAVVKHSRETENEVKSKETVVDGSSGDSSKKLTINSLEMSLFNLTENSESIGKSSSTKYSGSIGNSYSARASDTSRASDITKDSDSVDSDPIMFNLHKIALEIHNGDLTANIQKMKMIRGSRTIFSFIEESDQVNDMNFNLSKVDSQISVSKPAFLCLKFNDICDISAFISIYLRELNVLSTWKNDEEKKSNILHLNTSSFSIAIQDEDIELDLKISPMRLSNDKLDISQLNVNATTIDSTSTIKFKDICLDISQSIGMREFDGKSIVIDRNLTIESADLDLHQSVLNALGDSIKSLNEALQRTRISSSLPTNESKPRKVKIQNIDVSLRCLIKSLSINLYLTPPLGNFDIFIDNLYLDLPVRSSEISLNLSTIVVQKDLSQVGGSNGYQVGHPANKFDKRVMISISIEDGELKEIRLTNFAFEYTPKLIQLLEDMSTESSNDQIGARKQLRFPIFLINCSVGLNPLGMPSKAMLMINDGQIVVQNTVAIEADLIIRRASILLIDDISLINSHNGTGQHDQTSNFIKQGYVPVATLSDSRCKLTLKSSCHAQLSTELLTIDTCADSTQTLLQLANGLKPPLEISEALRYHTAVEPLDVMKDIDYDAFTGEGIKSSKDLVTEMSEDMIYDEVPTNIDFMESYYGAASTGQGSRSRTTNASSLSSSLGPSRYSRADLLLDQDLSALVSNRNTASPGSSMLYSSKSSGSSYQMGTHRIALFEQRTQQMDNIEITEDYIRQKSEETISSDDTNRTPVPTSELPRQRKESNSDHSEPYNWANDSPIFVLELSDSRVVWNLHDGYDWIHTKNTINDVVRKVEVEAEKVHRENEMKHEENNNGNAVSADHQVSGGHQMSGNHQTSGRPDVSPHPQEDENETEELIGNILFNSIYIGVPSGQDPKNLRSAINRELNDDISETMNSESTRYSKSPDRPSIHRPGDRHRKRLRLNRSAREKLKIELSGVRAEIMVLSAVETPLPENLEGALINRIRLSIKDMNIIDNVPTSTWNKFMMYMRSAGPREQDSNLIKLTMDTVKPIPSAAASELIINANVLPLRLHVDQDTLDFLTRFFQFKDERFTSQETDGINEEIFIQRAEVHTVKVKLDYKPKRVDYAGLKSGHTTEFMNFFILDEADIVLKHVVLHGISGFEAMFKLLNGIWLPDIRQTQLGGVLSGLAPVRSLVRLGGGMRDLVVIPIQQYQKDKRVVQGLQKGAWTFAKTTTNELVKLGAKLAAGTQSLLETAEQSMGGRGAQGRIDHSKRYISPYSDNPDDYVQSDEDEADTIITSNTIRNRQTINEEAPIVSLYADQPQTIGQGLHVAYKSLGRNWAIAKDAIADISEDTVERGSNAQGAAMAVIKAAPVALIRPVIGATEAVSKTLQGMTNQMDAEQRQETSDKYKQRGTGGG